MRVWKIAGFEFCFRRLELLGKLTANGGIGAGEEELSITVIY